MIDNDNKIIDNINDNINNLLWHDYIIFDEQYYGIPVVTFCKNKNNYIHNEYNCGGVLNAIPSSPCTCSTCENWHGCGRKNVKIYKCCKCNFECDKNVIG
jgi:hypothetical protein